MCSPSGHLQALDKLFDFPDLHIAVGTGLVRTVPLRCHDADLAQPSRHSVLWKGRDRLSLQDKMQRTGMVWDKQ